MPTAIELRRKRIVFGIALIVLAVSLGHVCVGDGHAGGSPPGDLVAAAPAPDHHEHGHLPPALCAPPPVTGPASPAHGGPPPVGRTADDGAVRYPVATGPAAAPPPAARGRLASPPLFLLHRSLLI